jgi:cytosine/adenosine deaminase-related metal-dependent hydrolase
MAGAYFLARGIDIDAEMDRIQSGGGRDDPGASSTGIPDIHMPGQLEVIANVALPKTDLGTLWDVHMKSDKVANISKHQPDALKNNGRCLNGYGALLAPSLCHPHVHLDKAYLLGHPKYADLEIKKGTFDEAMDLTSNAKARFTPEDLRERGQRLIDESVAAGVTHMRAFVEVDVGVELKCLEAGLGKFPRTARSREGHPAD